MTIAICIGCGCDDMHACWDDKAGRPCSWERVDRKAQIGVCSVCKNLAPAWDKGDRKPPSPFPFPKTRGSYEQAQPAGRPHAAGARRKR